MQGGLGDSGFFGLELSLNLPKETLSNCEFEVLSVFLTPRRDAWLAETHAELLHLYSVMII